jgi:hypothetical protein
MQEVMIVSAARLASRCVRDILGVIYNRDRIPTRQQEANSTFQATSPLGKLEVEDLLAQKTGYFCVTVTRDNGLIEVKCHEQIVVR